MEGVGSEEVGEGTSSAYREVGAGIFKTEASVTLLTKMMMMEDLGHLIEMRKRNMYTRMLRCAHIQTTGSIATYTHTRPESTCTFMHVCTYVTAWHTCTCAVVEIAFDLC